MVIDQQPLYVLPQLKIRAILPQVTILIFLSSIFYLGIVLNLSLLELNKNMQQFVQATSLVLLFFIILIGFLLAVKKAHAQYYFYPSQLLFMKKDISYLSMHLITVQQDPFDKIFQTYSLDTGNKFQIRNISKSIRVQEYLQQLVAYAKRQHTPN